MHYDLIVIGGGAAGITAAISAARRKHRVLLLEKLSHIGTKLKATGGGRCNLTNTLDNETFMARFGREGRFMRDVLRTFDHRALTDFLAQIGVATHAPDGYRVFPVTHNALSVVRALEAEMQRLGVAVHCAERVESLEASGDAVHAVHTTAARYEAAHVIIATGGLGYPKLGAEGEGYVLADSLGHRVNEPFPAMMPLHTKERWVRHCRADTIAKAEVRIDLKRAKKTVAVGDLIFTRSGIRGPVVLDFSREITPLLQRYGSVPLRINVVQGKSETQLHEQMKQQLQTNPHQSTLELLQPLLPQSLSRELCQLAEMDPALSWSRQKGCQRDALVRLMVKMPLTVVGHDGFAMAMITRGGIALKEIEPKTMQSRRIRNLYFCGEVVDLDGPCGGYNLQWSFASGWVAGMLGVRE